MILNVREASQPVYSNLLLKPSHHCFKQIQVGEMTTQYWYHKFSNNYWDKQKIMLKTALTFRTMLGRFCFQSWPEHHSMYVSYFTIYDWDRTFQKQISFRSPLQWLAIVYLTQCSTFNKFSSRRESQLVSYLLNLSRLLPRLFTQDDGCCLTGICLVTADYLRH